MALEMNNKQSGGLTYSSIGQKGTHTRIISLGSPELVKLREELNSLSLVKKETTLREILDRLDDQADRWDDQADPPEA